MFPHHIINKCLDFVYCFLIMACIIFCLYWIECCYVYNRIVTIMPYTFPYTFKYWLIPNCTRIIGRGHNCTRISCYSWLYLVYVHACTTKVKWKNKQQTVLVFSCRLHFMHTFVYNNRFITPRTSTKNHQILRFKHLSDSKVQRICWSWRKIKLASGCLESSGTAYRLHK